jgi:hypothetical protein
LEHLLHLYFTPLFRAGRSATTDASGRSGQF